MSSILFIPHFVPRPALRSPPQPFLLALRPVWAPFCALAVVRGVPPTFASGLLAPGVSPGAISLRRARAQHAAYVGALQRLLAGSVREVEVSAGHPDCVFVEDAALVHRGRALLPQAGAPAREGEGAAVGTALAALGLAVTPAPSLRLDGGDVLVTPWHALVGRSRRSPGGPAARRLLRRFFSGRQLREVPVGPAALHLKSAVTWVQGRRRNGGFLVAAREEVVREINEQVGGGGYEALVLDEEDAYAANTLSVGGVTLMARGFPRAARAVRRMGVDVVELEMSEFEKANGALTCLSIIVDDDGG